MTNSLYDIINFIIILSNNYHQTLINSTSVNITLLKPMILMIKSVNFYFNKNTKCPLHFHPL